MSAHPILLGLGKRVKALGMLCHGHNLQNLGTDLCSERTAIDVFEALIAEIERLRKRVAELEAKR